MVCAALRRKEVLTPARTGTDLEGVSPREVSRSQDKHHLIPLGWVPGVVRSTEIEVERGSGGKGGGGRGWRAGGGMGH